MDFADKIKALQARRENILSRRAKMEAEQEAAERRIKELETELQEKYGVKPEDLAETIQKLETKVNSLEEQAQEKIQEADKKLAEIEGALRT